MFHSLEHIRNKSRAERQTIAFSIAGGITGVVFLLWAVSFLASLEQESITPSTVDEPTHFSSFVGSLQDASVILQEQARALREGIQAVTEGEQSADQLPQPDVTEAPVAASEEDARPQGEMTDSGLEIIQVER
ncbi:MAG: hypothetical protein OQJ98_01605 [Candidatus Pacebacteria bacterium]|nr:hypothetical protein [Candidatus Paceibacterota bacterium]